MTRIELRKDEEFLKWLSQPGTAAQLAKLEEVVDTEVGLTGYGMAEPHFVHINFGIQDAVRRVRRILKDPTQVKGDAVPAAPPARYGVKVDES